MRVLMSAPFVSGNMIGMNAVSIALELTKLGVDVVPYPVSMTPGLPRQFTDLLVKDGRGDYDVALQFGTPQTIHPDRYASRATVNVGWAEWPRTKLTRRDMRGHGWVMDEDRTRWWGAPEGWEDIPANEKDWLDLMLVTAPDMIDVFSQLDPTVPYGVAPLGFDSTMFPEKRRSLDGRMTFLGFGPFDGMANAEGMFAAWAEAVRREPEFDARLVYRTPKKELATIGGFPPQVDVVEGRLGYAETLSLFNEAEVMISTDRGGATNRFAMEFMATGGVVIAADWMTHRNWLHPDTGYPVTGIVLPGAFGDFFVDTDIAATAILDAWRDRRRTARMGDLAARRVRQESEWEPVCKRFMQLVMRVM